MLLKRQAGCYVANGFLGRLEVIWHMSRLKNAKMSKKIMHFWQKTPGVNGLTNKM